MGFLNESSDKNQEHFTIMSNSLNLLRRHYLGFAPKRSLI